MTKFVEVTDKYGNRHFINAQHIVELKYAPEDWETKTVIYYSGVEKLTQLGVQEELEDILANLE